MALQWHEDARVELVASQVGDGPTTLTDVHVAFEGGFVHVATDGLDQITVYSAPATRRITYTGSRAADA